MNISIQALLFFLLINCAVPFSTKCLLKEDFQRCMKERQAKDGMTRKFVSDKTAICNDGSRAGYFVRKNPTSSVWIIYLEGALFCHDQSSCSIRMGLPQVTSSKFLMEKRIGNGLLSVNQHENPEFWQANHVHVPYCSSDFWIGNTVQRDGDWKIAFRGSRIVTAVVKELLSSGLQNATKLVMAGSSAGGIGVLQNIDRIASMVASSAERVEVRGIVDSAWFLDAPKKGSMCKEKNENGCSPNSMFKEAVKYWNAKLQSRCVNKHFDEKHKCLFAPNTIQFVKTPVFIFQWLQDTVQMLADNTELNRNPERMFTVKYSSYVKRLNKRMKTSLRSVARKHGLYAPSCVSHTALATMSSLNGFHLKGRTFHDALRCWLTDKKISKCRRRFVDDCDKMNCHEGCPAIYHPITGQEIRPKERMPKDNAKYYLELLSRFLVKGADKEKAG